MNGSGQGDGRTSARVGFRINAWKGDAGCNGFDAADDRRKKQPGCGSSIKERMGRTKTEEAGFRLVESPVAFHGPAVVTSKCIVLGGRDDGRVHMARNQARENHGLDQKDPEESYDPGGLHA